MTNIRKSDLEELHRRETISYIKGYEDGYHQALTDVVHEIQQFPQYIKR